MQTDFEQPRDRKLPKHTAFFPGQPPTEPPLIPIEPLTDKQFEFIVKALANERTDKAARLNETLREAHGDQAVLFNPATTPVLIWADPRTFERVVDYAAQLKVALEGRLEFMDGEVKRLRGWLNLIRLRSGQVEIVGFAKDAFAGYRSEDVNQGHGNAE